MRDHNWLFRGWTEREITAPICGSDLECNDLDGLARSVVYRKAKDCVAINNRASHIGKIRIVPAVARV